ncbi:NTPase KAP [Vibrio sp. Y2-5]|uniref:KAP family P-loop NTPase fold protein n=1 Tax=Vibrio sp. Y2-5 TaxID=2743977 RepID=UPI001660986B|nr:P-loop NTPase fold protein [Vibrio sp. Y2-5]MBD0786710.1 NTPase KAP [Vibrio sp. Y2-5]
MTQTIEMQWDNDVTVLGEHCPADKLDRAKYAQFLTGFLAGQGFDETKPDGEQKKNYVLNLNSEWGSGKTYFLKRWYHDLKQHYPVVYVDAWKQDYSDDPLLAVISSMTTQLRKQAGKDVDKAVFKVSRKAIGLLKTALPSIAGALTKRYLGVDPVAIMEASEDGFIGVDIEDESGNKIDMGIAASKAVQYLLDEHDAKSDAIASLKKSVEQWIQAVVGLEQRQYPAFIFIDELDRCRPSYAVEMLETIKHIFDIPGVVFVVGTDTDQLQHAVKAIYGEGFDARTYLGRFFNSRCTLKKPSFSSFLTYHCDTHKLRPEFLTTIKVWPQILDSPRSIEELDQFIIIEFQTLFSIYECFELTPRQSIQITNRLISSVSSLQKYTLNLPLLVILLCLNEKFPVFYNEIMRNQHIYNNTLENTKDPNILNINIRHKMMSIYLDPKQFSENQSFYSVAVEYPSDFYHCSIFDILEVSLDIFRTPQKDSNQALQPYVEQLSKIPLTEADKKKRGKYWVAINLKLLLDKDFFSSKLSLYKKLVELSSALD